MFADDDDEDENAFKPPAKPIAKAPTPTPARPATIKKNLLDSDDEDEVKP